MDPFMTKINRIIEEARSNPSHMERLYKRRQGSPRERQLDEKFPCEETRHFSERQLFDEGEDIVLFVDFRHELSEYHNITLESIREHFGTGLHTHEYFEITYVFRGECYCYFGGEEFHFKQGDLWFLNTQVSHKLLLPGDDCVLLHVCLRQTSFCSVLLDKIKSNEQFVHFFVNSIFDEDNNPCLMQFHLRELSVAQYYLLKMLEEYYDQKMHSQEVIVYLFCCLLIQLERNCEAEAVEQEAHRNGRQKSLDISEVIAYLMEHQQSVTLQQAATHFHYVPAYLSRFIQRHTGKSFLEFLNGIRLKRAAEMLRNTTLPISQISLMVGYSDRSSFDRSFKRQYHMTPRRYRDSGRESHGGQG